jgi:HPt (histidine-containing phosphotransfer) domain-containing protein
MHMPELSGIDVAKQIKYLLPSDICRIVLLTADTNSVATAYELNDIFSLVLTKPANPIDLLHNVHKLFDLQPMTGYQEGIIPTRNQSITNKEIQSRRLLNNIQIFGADAFRNLLMIYDSEVNEQLIKLTSAILSQNYSDKQSILHTLHGASLSVGSNEMGEKLIALLGDDSKTHQFDVNELLIVGSLAQLHKTFMCNCLEYLEKLDFNEKYIGRTHGRR